MIRSKKDFREYLEADRRMLNRSRARPPLLRDEVWKFQVALRKHEYHLNRRSSTRFSPVGRLLEAWFKLRHHYCSVLLGFTIPPNVFGPGLNIRNHGYIVVNAHARVGRICCLQQGVNIGQTYSKAHVPKLGDNVYIGPGAKIFGGIQIGNNVAIGANAVVTSFGDSVTIASIPARVVSERGSFDDLMFALNSVCVD